MGPPFGLGAEHQPGDDTGADGRDRGARERTAEEREVARVGLGLVVRD